jgi:RHS repeat-associated protein
VTPDNGTRTASANQTGLTAPFTIDNTGGGDLAVQFTCSRTGSVSSCTKPASRTLLANQVLTLNVTYATGAAGTGTLGLSMSTSAGIFIDNGAYTVTVTTPPGTNYTVAVAPDGGTVDANAGASGTFGFTVTNQGDVANAVYNLSVSCAAPVTCSLPSSSVTVSPGSPATANVNYTAGAAGTTGTITLTATAAANTSYTDNGSVTIRARNYAVDVTPNNGSVATTAGGAATQRFYVKNTGNVTGAVYNVAGGCISPVTCTVLPRTATLSPTESTFVDVSYTAGGAGTTGRVRVWAAAQASPTISDTGSVTVTVPGTVAATVSPDGDPLAAPASDPSEAATFTLANPGSSSVAVTFQCSVGGTVASCTAPSPMTLPGLGGSQQVSVGFATGTVAGAGKVTLKMYTNNGQTLLDQGYYDVTVTANHLAVSTAFMNNDNQSMALCAASCFGVTYAQSTVPYYSLDTPRSVTLIYNADRQAARAFIHADVSLLAGALTLSKYQLVVKRNGVAMTFLNGETTLNFAPGPVGKTVRLNGAIDFGGLNLPTAMYPVQIVVTAVYTNGETEVETVSTKLMIVNERKSSIARGWTIAGVQRLYVQSDNSVLLTEGDGSALYFATCGTNCYTTPGSEFSTLLRSGTGTSTIYKRVWKDSTTVTFDATGLMTSVRDRFGNGSTFEYDAAGRLIKILDPIRTYFLSQAFPQAYIRLFYNTYGLDSIQEPGPNQSGPQFGRVTRITRAADSTLLQIVDPDSVGTSFTYDATRYLSTITDRGGGVTTFAYNSTASSSARKLASVRSPSFVDDAGVPRQLTTTFTPWQTRGLVTSATATTPATPILVDSVRATIVAPGSATTRFTVNRWGQPLKVTDPVGAVMTIDRSGGVLPTTVTLPSGGVDRFRYTADGLLEWARPAGQDSVRIRYSATYAQPDSVWGPNQASVRIFLGAKGEADSVRVAGKYTTRFRYDARYRVDTVIDPAAHMAAYSYDPLFGNWAGRVLPGNRKADITFDGMGRVSSGISSGLARRRAEYDPVNRPTKAWTEGMTPQDTTRTFYGPLFADSVRDAKGQVYRATYNALGMPLEDYAPTAAKDSLLYAYDAAGRLSRWTNRRGETLTFTYDVLGRVLSKSGTNTVTDNFSYSADRRLVVGWNAVSRDSIFLGPALWTDSVSTTIATQRYRVGYTWDTRGRLVATNVLGPAGTVTFAARQQTRDPVTQELETIDVQGRKVILSYNLEGQRDTTWWPDYVLQRGVRFTTVHTPYVVGFTDGRLSGIQRWYGADSVGRISEEHRRTAGGFPVNEYRYDAKGQLNGVVSSTPTAFCSGTLTLDYGYACPTVVPVNIAYDAVGNATSFTGTAATYGPGNQIQSWGSITFTHDKDGNRTGKSSPTTTYTYTWSAEGQLLSTTAAGRTLEYDYSAFGQLVRRRVNGTADRHFLWDGDQLLAELNGTATRRVAEYAYLPGIDEPLALVTGATAIDSVRFLEQNEIGSVVGVFHGTGVVQNLLYDAKGDVSSVTGTLADTNRLRWKGLVWEGDSTQLYYVRNRWYDPETGRFMSEDPIGLAGGINLYVWAANDPINGRDPSGLCPRHWDNPDGTETPLPDANPGVVQEDHSGNEYVCNADGQWVRGSDQVGNAVPPNRSFAGDGGSTAGGGPVIFTGVNATAAFGPGATVGGGTYKILGGGVGLYGRIGPAFGLAEGWGGEFGASRSLQTFTSSPTASVCATYGVSVCVTPGSQNLVNGGSVGVGPNRLNRPPVNFKGGVWAEITWTFATKPVHLKPVQLRNPISDFMGGARQFNAWSRSPNRW